MSFLKKEIWISWTNALPSRYASFACTKSLHVWPLTDNNCFWAENIGEITALSILHNQLSQPYDIALFKALSKTSSFTEKGSSLFFFKRERNFEMVSFEVHICFHLLG